MVETASERYRGSILWKSYNNTTNNIPSFLTNFTMTADSILSKFTPGIVRYVDVLLKEGRVGMCSGSLRIQDVGTGCTTSMPGPCADRFKIVIPYAGHSVTWEILFNSVYPDDPPDFIFSHDDKDFVPDIGKLTHLVQWDAHNPQSLLLVLQQLLQEYKLRQQALIDKHSRLQFEYSSLLEGGYKAEEVEVHVVKRAENKYGPVNFLIKLQVDFSKIPAYLVKDNPGEDSAVLLVSFQNPEGGKAAPQLFLSPRVEHALGGSLSLRIPAFPNGGCLIDYVPSVCDLLKNKVDQIVQGYEKRKEYISAFLSHFGGSLIEHDSEGFSKISFIMEWHDFFFILIVDLPLMFPQDKPTLTFQSVYHEDNNGEPYNRMIKDYPYSPRWSAHEMATRTRAFILDHISSFQVGSVREGSFRQ